MKKVVCLTLGLGLLAGCTYMDVNMDRAKAKRDERRAAVQATEGCSATLYDHDAYRKCLLATYDNSTPKTFTPETLTNGQPIAVISNRKGTTPNNPIELNSTPHASVEPVAAQIVPMPTQKPTPAPEMVKLIPVTPTTTPAPIKQVGDKNVPCKKEVYETNIPANQVVIPCDTPPCPTVVQPTPQPVVAPTPQPVPEQTWWDTYQETKAQPEPVVMPEPASEPIVIETLTTPEPTLVCPCPDPNDPCPQCTEK